MTDSPYLLSTLLPLKKTQAARTGLALSPTLDPFVSKVIIQQWPCQEVNSHLSFSFTYHLPKSFRYHIQKCIRIHFLSCLGISTWIDFILKWLILEMVHSMGEGMNRRNVRIYWQQPPYSAATFSQLI